MKKLFFLVIYFTFYSSNAQSPYFNYSCGTPDHSHDNPIPESDCSGLFKLDFRNNHQLDMIPEFAQQKLKIHTNVIFVQNEEGKGNFDIDDPKWRDFFDDMYEDMNSRLATLQIPTADACSTNPSHYTNIALEFVPTYLELKHPTLWDHTTDQFPATLNSGNKAYLNEISDLAAQLPGYIEGFDVIITNDGPMYNKQTFDNPDNLPYWDLDYIPYYIWQGKGVWYSSRSVTEDFSKRAVWHCPDFYLHMHNGYEYNGKQWFLDMELPKASGAFLHEYFHYFDLGHYQTNNIMFRARAQRDALTGCQARIVYETLMTKHLRKYIICDQAIDHSITISEEEVWKDNMKMIGDIEIVSGGSLTINCKMIMQEGAKVIVQQGGKLIVDQGTITSECEPWHGIEVYGGNSDFDVKFTNNAVIENTSYAAVSMFAPEPWPEVQDFGNGILHADNTTFNNVQRIAELIAWSPSSNGSFVRNCTQNGGKHGITNWNCLNVEVSGSTFNDISHEAIVASTGEMNIINNTISSGVADILLTNTLPGFGSQISLNTFQGAEMGVKGFGSTVGNHRIFNNQFLTGQHDIFMDGDSHYEVFENDITSEFGISSIDNGLHINNVHLNTISGSTAGLVPAGANGRRYSRLCSKELYRGG